MLTPLNGAYKNTIIVREVDDTYIFIPNTTTAMINRKDFYSYEELIEQHTSCNIVIDSRLNTLIIYSILRYGDNTLIYNMVDRTVKNIYAFLSTYYKTPIEKLSLQIIKIWALTTFIDSYCLYNSLNIKPNELLHYLLMKNKNPNAFTFNFCIDVMEGCPSKNINKDKLKYTRSYVMKLVEMTNKHEYSIPPIDMNRTDMYHIRRVLELLFTHGYCINI